MTVSGWEGLACVVVGACSLPHPSEQSVIAAASIIGREVLCWSSSSAFAVSMMLVDWLKREDRRRRIPDCEYRC